jgi:hypothetical protein
MLGLAFKLLIEESKAYFVKQGKYPKNLTVITKDQLQKIFGVHLKRSHY